MQPDSSLPQEPQAEMPAQQVSPAAPSMDAPKMKGGFPVLTVILVLVIIGLGVWAIMLKSNLTKTQEALTSLQGQHKTLTAEKDKLSSNLDETMAELEATKAELGATKTELEKTKDDLSKAKEETATLRANMDKALDWLNVALAVEVDGEKDKSITEKVETLGDSKLKSLWKAAADFEIKSTNDIEKWLDLFNDFERYLFNTIVGFLK